MVQTLPVQRPQKTTRPTTAAAILQSRGCLTTLVTKVDSPDAAAPVAPPSLNYFRAQDLLYILSETVLSIVSDFFIITTYSGYRTTVFSIKKPVFTGQWSALRTLLAHYESQPKKHPVRLRFSISLASTSQEISQYIAFTRQQVRQVKVALVWNVLLLLLEGRQSLEALTHVLQFAHFLLKMTGHHVLRENVEVLQSILAHLLDLIRSPFPSVRIHALQLLYEVAKLNFLEERNIFRIRSLLTLEISARLCLSPSEERALLHSLGYFGSVADADPDKSAELCSLYSELGLRLQKMFDETLKIQKLRAMDEETTGELMYENCDSYRHSPELRMVKLEGLRDIQESLGNDEVALTQVVMCAVVLDIFTSLLRANPSRTAGITFPQYLPIRSDAAVLDASHRLCFTSSDASSSSSSSSSSSRSSSSSSSPSSSSTALRTPLSLHRAYGASWLCWDVLLRPIIPSFALYTFEELKRFNDNSVALEAIESSRWFTVERCITDLEKAATALDKAQLSEFAMAVRRILVGFYEALDNREALVAVYDQLSKKCAETVLTKPIKTRVQTKFYRITLYGKDFGTEHGKAYVQKEYNFRKLGEVRFALVEKYRKRFQKMPVIITNSGAVNLTEEQLQTPHVQVCAVEPFFTPEEAAMRRTEFMMVTNLTTFFYESIFSTSTAKHPEMHEMALRRTTMRLRHALPWCTRRVEIIPGTEKTVELTPAQRSAHELQRKIAEIRRQSNPVDEKKLQPTLSGAIAPQVNAGPMAIFRCFLVEHRATTSEADIALIKQTFVTFFRVSADSLKALFETMSNVELVETLIQKYNTLVDEVKAELVDVSPIDVAPVEGAGVTNT
jgi:hypothetical protein